jgi:hypothetical protein
VNYDDDDDNDSEEDDIPVRGKIDITETDLIVLVPDWKLEEAGTPFPGPVRDVVENDDNENGNDNDDKPGTDAADPGILKIVDIGFQCAVSLDDLLFF